MNEIPSFYSLRGSMGEYHALFELLYSAVQHIILEKCKNTDAKSLHGCSSALHQHPLLRRSFFSGLDKDEILLVPRRKRKKEKNRRQMESSIRTLGWS